MIFASSSRWQEEAVEAVEAEAEAADEGGGAQPVILEVNYSPDYGKMLELRPRFLDDVFARLFLDDDAASDGLWEALPEIA